MYNEDIGLETYNFKKLLDTTGTATFTAFRLKTWSKFQTVV